MTQVSKLIGQERAGAKLSDFAMTWAFPGALVAFALILCFKLDWQLLLSLDFSVVWEYRDVLARGIQMTLILTGISALFGLFFGIVLAVSSQLPLALVRYMVVCYVEIFRNTPLLVQLMWIHFVLPLVTGISTSAVESGAITMILQASAYFAEIVRSGINAVPKGQWEAAYALALPASTRWMRVILPPALVAVIPALVNLTMTYFKGTTVLSVLQVSELMTVTNRVANVTFHPIELFSTAAVVYLILGYALSRLTLRLEYTIRRRQG